MHAFGFSINNLFFRTGPGHWHRGRSIVVVEKRRRTSPRLTPFEAAKNDEPSDKSDCCHARFGGVHTAFISGLTGQFSTSIPLPSISLISLQLRPFPRLVPGLSIITARKIVRAVMEKPSAGSSAIQSRLCLWSATNIPPEWRVVPKSRGLIIMAGCLPDGWSFKIADRFGSTQINISRPCQLPDAVVRPARRSSVHVGDRVETARGAGRSGFLD